MNDKERLELAKAGNVRVFHTVDPDGAQTMVSISMDIVKNEKPEVWAVEYARLIADGLDDLHGAQP